jgi:DNA-binding LacI/PurR family transcriptional regulator
MKVAALLREYGHRRVVVPLDPVGHKMEIAVREGLAAGLKVDADDPALASFCPVFSQTVPAAWQQYWKNIFAKLRPTAMILSTDIQCLSLYGYCSRHGIRIPEDLSIICLETSEHLEWFDPVPTRMKFPVNRAAAYFKKWVRGGCQPMGLKFFSLDYVEGGTVVSTAPLHPSAPKRKGFRSS